ncbi:hypothetical protein Tco_0954217 [Tanacetum coccineum]|uniref:Uncharacterized protein n=1 Tax=Tanacetum coccineum TaxID=301880 RepID=A0ABQ5E2V8_9ASTR
MGSCRSTLWNEVDWHQRGSTETKEMKRCGCRNKARLVGQVDTLQEEVVKALFGLHQAPRACLMKKQISDEFMGELTFFLGLQVKQNREEFFISQDKYGSTGYSRNLILLNGSCNHSYGGQVAFYKMRKLLRLLQRLLISMLLRGSSSISRANPQLGIMTIVATSTTEAEYVAAANCCGTSIVGSKLIAGTWFQF